MAMARFWSHEGGTQTRSLQSANVATATASGFLVLVTLLSFVPDAPQPASDPSWQLRGTLAGDPRLNAKPAPRASAAARTAVASAQ